jgi:hypothetical protein
MAKVVARGARGLGRPSAAHASARALRLSHVWPVAALAFPIAVLTATPLGAIDLAYQVRAGDVMLSTHALLRTNILTFSAAGRPWLNQQWGAELVLGAAYRMGGWLGLAVTRALLAGAVLVLILLACRAAGASLRAASWLTLAAGTLLLVPAAFQLRGQLFGVLCFAAVLLLVAGRRRHPLRLWWAVPIAFVWANVHGSFFLGPILIGLGWLQDLADRDPRARRTLLAGLACAAATVITPFGPGVWGYVLGLSTNPLVRELSDEWRRPGLDTYLGASFLISAALVAAYLARRGEKVPWPTLGWLGVFFGLGLTATRMAMWWAVATPVVLAGLPPRTDHRRAERPDPASPLNTVIALALVAIALAGFTRWIPYTGEAPPATLVSFAPPGITAELRRTLQPGERWFNPQEWGSWFELALPANPVFVDSRMEVIPDGVWQDYYAVSLARQGWQDVLDQWGIDVVVLARDQQRSAIPAVAEDPGWRLVYQDADGLIFVRR